MSKKSYAKSVFTGILVAVLLSIYIFFLVPFIHASTWAYGLVISALVVPLLGIYLEGESKKASAIMLVLFVASASLASWVLMDSFVVPQEHKAPRYQILSNVEGKHIVRDSRYHDEPTWRITEFFLINPASYPDEPIWGFYEPDYYTVAYMEKNKSLEVADFYYRGYLTFNPYYSVPQALHKKLAYGYATSVSGYKDYKTKLESHGFKIEENSSSFIATNDSTVVHCYLDGKHLVVAKATKDNSHLLKQVVNQVVESP